MSPRVGLPAFSFAFAIALAASSAWAQAPTTDTPTTKAPAAPPSAPMALPADAASRLEAQLEEVREHFRELRCERVIALAPAVDQVIRRVRFTWCLEDPVTAELPGEAPFWIVRRQRLDQYLVEQAVAAGCSLESRWSASDVSRLLSSLENTTYAPPW